LYDKDNILSIMQVCILCEKTQQGDCVLSFNMIEILWNMEFLDVQRCQTWGLLWCQNDTL